MAWRCHRGCGSWYDLSLLPGDTHSAGVCIEGLIIFGTPPSVLFGVTRWCMRGVSLRVRFAVGFCACKIGGTFVMRGTSGTVMMGVLSITLCCCIHISLSLTLCSSKAIVGFKIFLMFARRSLMSLQPFCLVLAIAVDLASSSVSAWKCWCGVRCGSWQCCRNSLVKPEIWYTHVLGMKYKLHL